MGLAGPRTKWASAKSLFLNDNLKQEIFYFLQGLISNIKVVARNDCIILIHKRYLFIMSYGIAKSIDNNIDIVFTILASQLAMWRRMLVSRVLSLRAFCMELRVTMGDIKNSVS